MDVGYRAIIFDFDYTLGDATEAIVAGFAQGLRALGYPAAADRAVRETVGMPLEDAFTLLTGNGDGAARERFREEFAAVARPMQRAGTPLCPGAAELLRALHARGILTAVVSTKNTPTLEIILAQHGLMEQFSLVIGGDLVARAKPDPEGLNAAVARLGLAAEEVLYCGDTVIDAETARRAGTAFCAVLNGTTAAPAFEAYPKVHVAPDLMELGRWLDI